MRGARQTKHGAAEVRGRGDTCEGNSPGGAKLRALRTLSLGTVARPLVVALLVASSCVDPPPPGEPPPPSRDPIPLVESQPFGHGGHGVFQVLDDGSASYSVPIAVPAGRRGVQPELSLTYSSRGGDGPLGVGWQLAGLSQIARCGETPAYDGAADGVRFEDDDALCMDGGRLVLVAGEAGADGAVYRPRRNGYERVRLHGALADATSYFEVEHPNGSRTLYGDADGARNAYLGGERYVSRPDGLPIDGEEVQLAWLVSRHTDRDGNYVRYRYARDRTDVQGRSGFETRIDEIRYTGHRLLGDGERVVRFRYEERDLPVDRFVSGLWLLSTQILKGVESYAPGSELAVRTLELMYTQSRHTSRPLLWRVQHCGGDGVCLPATEFTYTESRESAPEVQFTERGQGPTPDGWFNLPGVCTNYPMPAWPEMFALEDLDGDGAADLLYPERIDEGSCQGVTMDYRIRRSVDGALGPPLSAGITPPPRALFLGGGLAEIPAPPLVVTDLDDDGFGELIDRRRETIFDPVLVNVWEWSGAGLTRTQTDLFECGADDLFSDLVLLGDVDGSGEVDLVGGCQTSGTELDWFVRPHGGAEHGVFDAPTMLFTGDAASTHGRMIDVDGDGRSELLTYRPGAPYYEARSLRPADGGMAVTETNLPVPDELESEKLIFIDVNGDGLRDLLDLREGAFAVLRFNTGRGFSEPSRAFEHGPVFTDEPWDTADAGSIRVADFNHDGRQDFALLRYTVETDRAEMFIHYSTGRSFRYFEPRVLRAAPFHDGDRDLAARRYSWASVQVGDVTGDGELDFLTSHPTGGLRLLESRYGQPDLLAAVHADNPPFDQETLVEVEYRAVRSGGDIDAVPPGSDRSEPGQRVPYVAGQSCPFPQRCLRSGITVVVHHEELTGAPREEKSREAVTTAFDYSYRDARVNVRSGQFLGFQSRSRDEWFWERGPLGNRMRQDRVTTRWSYDLETQAADGIEAFPGMPVAREVVMRRADAAGFIYATREETTLATGPIDALHPSIVSVRSDGGETTEHSFTGSAPASLDGAPYDRRSTSTIVPDELGLPVRWLDIIEGGDEREVITVPVRDLEANVFDRVDRVVETSRVGGPATREEETRIVDLEYQLSGTGRLRAVHVHPDDARYGRTVTYSVDALGVIFRIAESARDPFVPGTPTVERVTELEYDAERLFPTSVRRVAGGTPLVTYTTYHRGLGVLQRVTDPSRAEREHVHDHFGRLREVRRAGGGVSRVDYLAPASATEGSRERHADSTGALVELGLDVFGRPTSRIEQGLLPGERWVSATELGRFGETRRVELPHREGSPAPTVVHEHDDLLRPVATTHPDGSTTRYAYQDAFTTAVRDPRGHLRTAVRDAQHRVVTEVAPDGARTLYRFGTFGRLGSVRRPDLRRWSYQYDPNGSLASVRDPYGRLEELEHDAFGDLRVVTHADASTASFTYDAVGRVVERRDDDGTTEWAYDEDVAARGRLSRSESADGTVERRVYGEGARAGFLLQRDVTTPSGERVQLDYGYDAHGRPATLRASGGPREEGLGLTLGYSATGHMDSVAHDDAPLWRARELHPRGFVAQEVFANGVATVRDLEIDTDRAASLTSSVQELSVGFDESLNATRVDDAFAVRAQDITYDVRDRVARWSTPTRAVQYAYDEIGNVLENESGSLRYRRSTGLLQSAVGERVEQDRRGRLTTSLERDQTFTDFDLLRRVDSREGEVTYEYTADHERVAARTRGGEGESTTLVVGPYRREVRDGRVREVLRAPGRDRVVAELETVDGAAPSARYLHDDHLGSTAVVTDEAGDVVDRVWFSPYGRRIDEGGEFVSPDDPLGVQRYTVHELDTDEAALGSEDAGLIHMQGRAYDPVLGRFLSPDPFVGLSGAGPERWNAEAYANNNPTTVTDPTGFWPVGRPDRLFPDPAIAGPAWGRGGLTYFGSGGLGPDFQVNPFGTQRTFDAQRSPIAPGWATGPTGGQRLDRAINRGLIRGTRDLLPSTLETLLAVPFSPQSVFYRAALAYAAGSRGDYVQAAGELVSIHPVVGISRMATEGGLGAGDLGATGYQAAVSGDIDTVGGLMGAALPVMGVVAITHTMSGAGGAGGGSGASGATRAIGFAHDAAPSAYQGMRSGGGHAMRHLIDEGLIPNAGSLASRAQTFERLTSPILRSPAASFDWRVGGTAARAFAGEAGGRQVVVFVAKEGPYQGRVLSAIVPDAAQIAQWGL